MGRGSGSADRLLYDKGRPPQHRPSAHPSDSVKMLPVESSNVCRIGYSRPRRELHVEVISGATYIYSQVPAEIFERFIDAESKGRFFSAIVQGNYDSRKIPAEN